MMVCFSYFLCPSCFPRRLHGCFCVQGSPGTSSRRAVVSFKTPPKKQKVSPLEQSSGLGQGLSMGLDSDGTGVMTMSPEYLLEWSRHIVKEVDSRTAHTIRSG